MGKGEVISAEGGQAALKTEIAVPLSLFFPSPNLAERNQAGRKNGRGHAGTCWCVDEGERER